MVNLSLKLDPRKIISNYNKLASDFPQATASAINKTATQAFNAGNKEITDTFNIKKSTVKENYSLRKANKNYLIAKIWGIGRFLPFIDFGAKEVAKGVTYKIKKRGARKILKGAFITYVASKQKAGFIGPANAHEGVFIRAKNLVRWSKGRPHTSSPNLPIEQKYSIGVATMLGSKNVKAKITDYFNNNFARIFKHEIEWRLKK